MLRGLSSKVGRYGTVRLVQTFSPAPKARPPAATDVGEAGEKTSCSTIAARIRHLGTGDLRQVAVRPGASAVVAGVPKNHNYTYNVRVVVSRRLKESQPASHTVGIHVGRIGSLYLCLPRDIVCVHKIFIHDCAITSPPKRPILALLLHLAPAVIAWGKGIPGSRHIATMTLLYAESHQPCLRFRVSVCI